MTGQDWKYTTIVYSLYFVIKLFHALYEAGCNSRQYYSTRKSSCVNARGIPPPASQVLAVLLCLWGGGGEYLYWIGGPTLDGGYPPWMGRYLPWMEGNYLEWGYLPWMGYLPWTGVPILNRGGVPHPVSVVPALDGWCLPWMGGY